MFSKPPPGTEGFSQSPQGSPAVPVSHFRELKPHSRASLSTAVALASSQLISHLQNRFPSGAPPAPVSRLVSIPRHCGVSSWRRPWRLLQHELSSPRTPQWQPFWEPLLDLFPTIRQPLPPQMLSCMTPEAARLSCFWHQALQSCPEDCTAFMTHGRPTLNSR